MRGLLGADIFVNLLLVFIITTGLLLMNSGKNNGRTARDLPTHMTGHQKTSEMELPKIDLPKGGSGGVPAGKDDVSITLSAKIEGLKTLYFLDEKPVSFDDLRACLVERRASSVKIRFDGNLTYGSYIRALEVCKKAGVKEIINVYSKR